MFCRQCGERIDDGSKFCNECGAAQQAAAVPRAQETPEPKYEYCHVENERLDQDGFIDNFIFVRRRKRQRYVAKGEGASAGKIYAAGDVFDLPSDTIDYSAADVKLWRQHQAELCQKLEGEGWTWIGKDQYELRFRRRVQYS